MPHGSLKNVIFAANPLYYSQSNSHFVEQLEFLPYTEKNPPGFFFFCETVEREAGPRGGSLSLTAGHSHLCSAHPLNKYTQVLQLCTHGTGFQT